MKTRGLNEKVEVNPGAKARLMDRCERAKIDLSSRSNVEIYVASFFRGIDESELDYTLSQGELEATVGHLLDKGFKRIEKVLDDAGYSPEQVALCVATGGMSNMPAVKRRLHEWFGPERVRIPDGTATLIAEGAAWIAADRAGLQLAKNVEVLLSRNSYLPLVKAGTEMPKEGEVQSNNFNLYCTDPRDGIAKFQICAPKRAGSSVLPGDPRDYLATVTVKVDAKAKAFHERLELRVQIDDNLILEVNASSLNLKDRDKGAIHNLEFGLRFPVNSQVTDSGHEAERSKQKEVIQSSLGSLAVRANLAREIDLSLVPREFLYEYDPRYFDLRRDPPAHQIEEMLYYKPCSLCGRASNDPACKCASLLPNPGWLHRNSMGQLQSPE